MHLVDLDKKDCITANILCCHMACYFSKEKDRVSAFLQLLSSYIGILIRPVLLQNEAKCVGAIEVKGSPCVIIEAKNEVGTAGSDSYPQLIAHYIQMLRKQVVRNCPGLTYFIELVGATHVHLCCCVWSICICGQANISHLVGCPARE